MPINWSKLRYKGIPLVIIVILSIIIAALKIRDILMYFSVPFILYMVYRLISRFTVYKVLFTLIAVSTVGEVVLLVKEVVSSVNKK
jgi:hypothetical protein